MQRLLLILAALLMAAPLAPAKDRNYSPAFTSSTAAGSTTAGSRYVLFIFSSDFVGTIGGVAFTGAADSSLELRAPEGDTFAAIPWTRSAGTVRVVQY